MKTTLEIPDTVFRRAKSAAAARGIPLRVFVTEAVKDKIAAETEARAKPWLKHMGRLQRLHKETVRINRLIEGVSITHMGRVQFGKTDEVKTGLRQFRDQLVKAKALLPTVENRVRASMDKVYDAVEKGQAYSTVWGGA